MIKIEFSNKELTYLLLALKKYERELLSTDDEDMEDSVNDLLIIQGLQIKIASQRNDG